MEILDIKNLTFRYPNEGYNAVDNVSLKIESGEFVVICGESGCGKSTLLRLIKRELSPAGEKSGEILYNGINTDDLTDREAAEEIGYVMQNPNMQIVTDKVWHELAFGLENLGLPTDAIRRRTAEMASYFGIQEWFRKNTEDLSGGQKQLLNLASIMVMQPKVLVLDEPTSQLDPIAASEFISTLHKLNKDLALTIILVEHRLEEVFPIADKVAVMDEGKVIAYDKPNIVGEQLRSIDHNHGMLLGLPCSIRIFNGLSQGDKCPVTIKEGREYLSKYFTNTISGIGEKRIFEGDEICVRMKNVWFRYERTLPDVLRGMNMEVYKGEIYSLLGGNGTGKSTALKVLSGQKRAYRGDVEINGKKISKYTKHELYHNNIALLPQNPQDMFLKSTVKEDLEEITKHEKLTREESEMQINQICVLLGIDELLERHPYDLSGGEQQKAALAKVLLLKPQILLLDEPTKGIDAHAKYKLGQTLKGLREQGITIVIVTHDVEFAAEVSDRCAMFFDGEIMSAAQPRSFFSDNNFYTTAASRISRHLYKNTVLCSEVIEMCQLNVKGEVKDK